MDEETLEEMPVSVCACACVHACIQIVHISTCFRSFFNGFTSYPPFNTPIIHLNLSQDQVLHRCALLAVHCMHVKTNDNDQLYFWKFVRTLKFVANAVDV